MSQFEQDAHLKQPSDRALSDHAPQADHTPQKRHELPANFDFQQAGKQVLSIERDGLAQLDQYIDDNFTLACKKIFHCQGKVVVMGMGKSGHIGCKIAATFASTGTPAFLSIQAKPATVTSAW